MANGVHYLNGFMNQNKHNGKPFLLTNDSDLPTLNRLFEADLRSVLPELGNLYFVSGTRFPEGGTFLGEGLGGGGGLHCRIVERSPLFASTS